MDYRLQVGFLDHPKSLLLSNSLGDGAVLSLLRLWEFATLHRPTGDLSGYPDQVLELAARWTGRPGVLLAKLAELRWLDGESGSYRLHDWESHNGWVAGHANRSAVAKANSSKRWRVGNAVGNAVGIPDGIPDGNADGNAPSPSPSPSPSLKKNQNPHTHAREDGFETTNPHEREPTPDEVKTVAALQGFPEIDAESFLSKYRATGWMRGSTPISDWRPLVTVWRNHARASPKATGASTPRSAADRLRERYTREEAT